jgi:hypothetical protein
METKYMKKNMKPVPLQLLAINCEVPRKGIKSNHSHLQQFQPSKANDLHLLQELVRTVELQQTKSVKTVANVKGNPLNFKQEDALNISKKPQFIKGENVRAGSFGTQRCGTQDIYLSQVFEAGMNMPIPEAYERLCTPNSENPSPEMNSNNEAAEKAVKTAELANYMAVISSNKYKVLARK